MVSTTAAYPASHKVALERVLLYVDLVAARPDIEDTAAVAALMQAGIGEVDAELLVRFVPSAMSYGLLKLLGISRFPSTFQVRNDAGQWIELPLASEHYCTAALVIGYDIATRGYTERLSKETFRAVTLQSAEMNTVNEFFGAGHKKEELANASLAPLTLIGVTADMIAESRETA